MQTLFIRWCAVLSQQQCCSLLQQIMQCTLMCSSPCPAMYTLHCALYTMPAAPALPCQCLLKHSGAAPRRPAEFEQAITEKNLFELRKELDGVFKCIHKGVNLLGGVVDISAGTRTCRNAQVPVWAAQAGAQAHSNRFVAQLVVGEVRGCTQQAVA